MGEEGHSSEVDPSFLNLQKLTGVAKKTHRRNKKLTSVTKKTHGRTKKTYRLTACLNTHSLPLLQGYDSLESLSGMGEDWLRQVAADVGMMKPGHLYRLLNGFPSFMAAARSAA